MNIDPDALQLLPGYEDEHDGICTYTCDRTCDRTCLFTK